MTIADMLKKPDPTPEEQAALAAAHKEHIKQNRKLLQEIDRELKMEARGPIEPPDILTLRERLARPRLPTAWRITDWQAIGHRVIFAAQYKAGKTTTVSNVVRSLLDASPFLDTYDVSPLDGTVALLDFEMAGGQLDDWYRDQNIVADDRLWVIPMRGRAGAFDIVDKDVRAGWVEILKSRGVKYLILDCLRPILDALGLNEHSEVGVFLTALDALLAEADIPEAVVVHHMGHAHERSRGDSRLLDWPDVNWTLVRETEDPASARFIKAYGRGIDVPETKLDYNPITRRLGVAGGSRRDSKLHAALPAVLAFIGAAQKPPSLRNILEGLKDGEHSDKDLRGAVKLGVREGKIATESGPKGATLHRLVEKTDGLDF
jgi:hypothetical protein